MSEFIQSWWFRIPFGIWFLGILLFPHVYNVTDSALGYERKRQWAWEYIADDWNGFGLLDWGTVLYQFCILLTLVVGVRWFVMRIVLKKSIEN